MTTPQPIRILLADDHINVHISIAAVIEFIDGMLLVAQASDGAEAFHLCREARPDIVLMDVIMPRMNGIEATRQIREAFPEIKVLALSSFQDDESIREMLEVGAIGYLLKNSSIEDLASTIRTVFAGKSVMSPEVMQSLLQKPESLVPSQDYGLTDRELEVLKLMIEGQTNNEIAYALSISISTVKFHIRGITEKLNVDSRTEAVAVAVAQHLVN
jgi:two-component system, NarL family, response regulator LiaR